MHRIVNNINFTVYQDDSSDELSEVMDDLLLPASDTDDNWFQDEDEDDSDDESENDNDENSELEQDISDNEEVLLANGESNNINGDDMMESE